MKKQFLEDAIEYAGNYIKRKSMHNKAFEADGKAWSFYKKDLINITK